MSWACIGYFLRTKLIRAGYQSPYPDYPDAQFPAPAHIDEICSAGICPRGLGDSALDSDEKWNRFFGMDGYEAPEKAYQVVPKELLSKVELYVFRIAPTLFRDGLQQPFDPVPTIPEPPVGPFERLGYDAVQYSHGELCCSPLVCNSLAGKPDIPAVNRFCLMETIDDAFTLATACSLGRGEPGPYVVIEVCRSLEPLRSNGNVTA